MIDLKRCIACYACVVACKIENKTPPGIFWARLIRAEGGKYPTVIRQPLPLLCMQCKEPECEKVCPTGATKRRPDGIVTVDPNLCMGCKYCVVACPYEARHFVDDWKDYFTGTSNPSSPYFEYAKNEWLSKYGKGVATKCNFCIERVEKGSLPACVEACPTEARIFGDLDDPESEVSILIKKRKGFQLHPEYGTDPAVYYLPPR